MGAADYRGSARRRRSGDDVLDFRVPGGAFSVRQIALLLLSALAAAVPAAAGTVRGQIQLFDKGGRPAADITDVVVFVDGARARSAPAKATMAMKGKSFIPHVIVVPVGGTVEFPNEDPIFHNVFSVSGENRFDLELYKRPKSGAWTFQHAGVARVYCNIHPQMNAIVIVRDNPYFTKTAQDGSFAIPDVPAGKYVVRAWHERGGEAAEDVTVAARGDTDVRLTLDASGFKRTPHKNKYGKDYSNKDEKY
jgi:plastocyanin